MKFLKSNFFLTISSILLSLFILEIYFSLTIPKPFKHEYFYNRYYLIDEGKIFKNINNFFKFYPNISKRSDGYFYVNEKFVRGRDDITQATTTVVEVSKDEVIRLTSPKWSKPNKLITVPSPGFFDIEGEVGKSVDQITLNDEDLIIENDRTFSETLLIKNEDLDIRIIAYKDGEQLGKLTFIVKTKN